MLSVFGQTLLEKSIGSFGWLSLMVGSSGIYMKLDGVRLYMYFVLKPMAKPNAMKPNAQIYTARAREINNYANPLTCLRTLALYKTILSLS